MTDVAEGFTCYVTLRGRIIWLHSHVDNVDYTTDAAFNKYLMHRQSTPTKVIMLTYSELVQKRLELESVQV
jgi:hypothetical protein